MALVAVPVTAPDGIFERELWSNVTKPFYAATTITSTTLLSVWTPTSGKKFVLKGFELTAVVRVAMAAANPKILGWWDDSISSPICSAGMAFDVGAPIGTFFSTPGVVWLREGISSGAVNRVLKLGVSGDLMGGTIEVMGCAYGEEL
jgi:hypothetical protein